MDEARVLGHVAPAKDVDGLHPHNVHQLATTKTHFPGRSSFCFDSVDFHVTCTPQVNGHTDTLTLALRS